MDVKRIIAVFQPHTFSRLHALFDDFVKAFEDADIKVFADVFAAREENVYGVSSEMLADAVSNGLHLDSFEKIAEYIKNTAKEGDLILFMGAGDIYKAEKLLF